MPTEIKFPTKPFYIMSKINRSNWSLTINAAGGVALTPLEGKIEQLWTAAPDPRGGAVLHHVATGLVLSCQLQKIFGQIEFPSGPLKAVQFDASDARQLWRAEDLGDGWSGINTLLNWEAKINVYGSNVRGVIGVYGWDGGADNEEWKLVPEAGEITVDSVEYFLERAVADLHLPPSHCAITSVDNTKGGAPVTSTYSLARTVTTQRSISNSTSETTGRKYTQTFGVKGGVDKVFEVSASASFEESESQTISFTDQTVHTETVTDTISTQVQVPIGKKYAYHVVVYYGRAAVPYRANLTFTSSAPGGAVVKFVVDGIFTGVNQVNSEIVVRDITAPQNGEAPLVKTLELA
ncbi:hypothetical protein [Caulobacter endophyticus]|uniref:Uncharacterized protein n=1 Tax=Caulobacter endophyticus TaxID=2172652 RepID=A0A2T9KDV5_9CAUL|nr:hypothetical protein [Caulobacter endophyticus]PVM94164.1 hypothetical protein DDF67_00405 [Caulobacter endophyticus]